MKKKIAVTDPNECMTCAACVVACADKFHKTTYEEDSCIQFNFKGNDIKIKACVQCGKCAKNCPEEAITQNKFGVYTINKKKCVNCGKCAEVCPFGLIVYKPNGTAPNKCIVCGACVKACPAEILYVMEKE